MRGIDSRMATLRHETIIEREASVWPAVKRILGERDFNLVI